MCVIHREDLSAQTLGLRSSRGLSCPMHSPWARPRHPCCSGCCDTASPVSVGAEKPPSVLQTRGRKANTRLVGTHMKHAGNMSGDLYHTPTIIFNSCLETWTQQSARPQTGFKVEAYRIPGPTAAFNSIVHIETSHRNLERSFSQPHSAA